MGQRHGSLLVKCGRGEDEQAETSGHPDAPTVPIPRGSNPNTFQEVWTSMTPDGVCFVHFDFHNGAMSNQQCKLLMAVLKEVKENDSCI